MPTLVNILGKLALAASVIVLIVSHASAQGNYDPGASDTEIKIGNVMPYSGPLSAFASIGKAEAAYFAKINAEGGVNGRKITFISYDDSYSPPKAVEQTRKLVESDEVLAVFSALGAPSNNATQKYLNSKKIPQLFVSSGASKFGDPKTFPWTIGWPPTFKAEGKLYGKYIAEHYPNSKVAVLWQNDDSAKDSMAGFREGLGTKTDMVVAEKAYEVSEPTIDSEIVTLKESGADIFLAMANPKAAAQAIKKVTELGWKPVFILATVSTSVAAVLRPAGLENAKGIVSSAWMKDPTDPSWHQDPGTAAWLAFMDKYLPEGDKSNVNYVYGYIAAQALVEVLKQCGDDLSRANVMKQAADLKGFRSEMMLPGIEANTSPTDFYPIEQMQLMQFDGNGWKLFGGVIDVGSSNRRSVLDIERTH
jgi:ABC-type branched-subunit amino acid transport system substrate-binding protein